MIRGASANFREAYLNSLSDSGRSRQRSRPAVSSLTRAVDRLRPSGSRQHQTEGTHHDGAARGAAGAAADQSHQTSKAATATIARASSAIPDRETRGGRDCNSDLALWYCTARLLLLH